MNKTILLLIALSFFCEAYSQNKISEYYDANKGDNLPSKAIGTVSDGALKNAKLVPFSGENFFYYNETSYLQGRAYTHSKVKEVMLKAYAELNDLYPGRKFGIMECSKKTGGKIWPHRTHQNGLSVDFMMPLKKNSLPYYELDQPSGMQSHYLLDFDKKGRYSGDTTVAIDFDLVAHHILLLEKQAKANGLKISKVIINTDLKDDLFRTKQGKILKQSGIYIVKALPEYVNKVHDDHYHIDFAELNN
jgi:penicillin-insensitive murein endopeptidase